METKAGVNTVASEGRVPGQDVPAEHTYLDFLFFKLNPEYRRLSVGERSKGVEEFLAVFKKWCETTDIRTYLTLGLRSEIDFLLWVITKDFGNVQEFVSAVYKTGLGKYLDLVYSYPAVTKPSQYAKSHKQNFELGPSKYKYLFVYPFIKSNEWYALPIEERMRMMKQHNIVGGEFPSVKINTTYSFGLNDNDFMLAFECDEPKIFSDLVQRLRETEARKYTVKDTPMIICANKTIDEVIGALAV